jgi:hypothetical protein
MTTPHAVQWVTAQPLWRTATATPEVMQRPALLRFETDTFMDELAAELAARPEAIGDRVATWKTYREPPPRAPGEAWAPAPEPLKLYQPAHGHFYLVTGNLVCRLAGLPDHRVQAGQGERVGFVLRRWDGASEMAWVADPTSAAPRARRWRPLSLAEADKLADGEDVTPMFPVTFQDGDRRRRLLAGFVPTASAETFEAGAVTPGAGAPDPRLEELETKVIQPLALLLGTPPSDAATETREQEASRLVLLELASWLANHVPAVFAAVIGDAAPPESAADLVTLLSWRTQPGGPSWRDGMRVAWAERDRIAGETTDAPTLTCNLSRGDVGSDALRACATVAVRDAPVAPAPAPVPEPKLSSGATYAIRCVYQRPRCGALKPAVVSNRTEAFRLAGFYDADAPARPIRISLPIDPSPAGIRKLKKNVAVVLSDQLRKKVAASTGFKDGKVGPGVGFDCGGFMLSIPILTICALIVLFIFLSLLNLVFWWLPFVKICLPKPEVE